MSLIRIMLISWAWPSLVNIYIVCNLLILDVFVFSIKWIISDNNKTTIYFENVLMKKIFPGRIWFVLRYHIISDSDGVIFFFFYYFCIFFFSCQICVSDLHSAEPDVKTKNEIRNKKKNKTKAKNKERNIKKERKKKKTMLFIHIFFFSVLWLCWPRSVIHVRFSFVFLMYSNIFYCS